MLRNDFQMPSFQTERKTVKIKTKALKQIWLVLSVLIYRNNTSYSHIYIFVSPYILLLSCCGVLRLKFFSSLITDIICFWFQFCSQFFPHQSSIAAWNLTNVIHRNCFVSRAAADGVRDGRPTTKLHMSYWQHKYISLKYFW